MKELAVARASAAPRRSLTREILYVLAAVAALAVSAQLNCRIGPVPITAQTLAVMLIGVLLGSKRGAAAVLSYLAVGATGLPVFAYGGGVHYFLLPSAGYLIGFVPGAFVIGYLIEHGWGRRGLTALAALGSDRA